MSSKRNKGGLSVEAPCEGGGTVAIALSATEVAQAKSILARIGCTKLFVMKRDAKSAAMFYAVEADAVYAQQAYGIEYLMTIDADKFNSVSKGAEMPMGNDSQIND